MKWFSSEAGGSKSCTGDTIDSSISHERRKNLGSLGKKYIKLNWDQDASNQSGTERAAERDW